MSKAVVKENKMATMPVNKLMMNMGVPMIISMMLQAVYNIVDSVYVSQISESAVTALSLAFPIQNMEISHIVKHFGLEKNQFLSKEDN